MNEVLRQRAHGTVSQFAKDGDRRDACPTLLVAESGIHTRADVERLAKCGAQAILVGESLMRHGNIRSKVKELLGVA